MNVHSLGLVSINYSLAPFRFDAVQICISETDLEARLVSRPKPHNDRVVLVTTQAPPTIIRRSLMQLSSIPSKNPAERVLYITSVRFATALSKPSGREKLLQQRSSTRNTLSPFVRNFFAGSSVAILLAAPGTIVTCLHLFAGPFVYAWPKADVMTVAPGSTTTDGRRGAPIFEGAAAGNEKFLSPTAKECFFKSCLFLMSAVRRDPHFWRHFFTSSPAS